jgi:hypothetical protein
MDYSLPHSSRTTQCPRTRLTPVPCNPACWSCTATAPNCWARPCSPGCAATRWQPLEEEVLLVQSNGMAEWLKMALATAGGVCAATRVELPARFLWRAYRQVLGRAAVPTRRRWTSSR